MEFIAYLIIGLLVLAATGFLTYFYARKDTHAIAYAATYVGWFFGFMLIGILPCDIYIVSHC
jgi:hypothetical protein